MNRPQADVGPRNRVHDRFGDFGNGCTSSVHNRYVRSRGTIPVLVEFEGCGRAVGPEDIEHSHIRNAGLGESNGQRNIALQRHAAISQIDDVVQIVAESEGHRLTVRIAIDPTAQEQPVRRDHMAGAVLFKQRRVLRRLGSHTRVAEVQIGPGHEDCEMGLVGRLVRLQPVARLVLDRPQEVVGDTRHRCRSGHKIGRFFRRGVQEIDKQRITASVRSRDTAQVGAVDRIDDHLGECLASVPGPGLKAQQHGSAGDSAHREAVLRTKSIRRKRGDVSRCVVQ